MKDRMFHRENSDYENLRRGGTQNEMVRLAEKFNDLWNPPLGDRLASKE
jgi:hypothetical protein